jgi:signal transduction histidine kinase
VVAVVGLVSVAPYVWSIDDVAIALTIGLAAVLVVLRRSLSALMLAAAWTAVALFGAGGLWRRAVPDPSMLDLRTLMYSLGFIAIACMVAASAARSPAAILADDVIRVSPTPQGLRERMAAAVGDPHLRLGWWDAERAAFVDDFGSVVSDDPPAGNAPIKVTLADAGEALIVCSSAVATDPQTREALARVTVLATEAARLDDELGRRIDEVARSSARLLLAGDAERRDVRRLLDADVAAPLGRLAARLGAAGVSSAADGPVERAALLFDRCARQLRDVSVGLPPSELDAGLAEALQVLGAASPLPVEVRVEPAPYELTIATALYYICAEALSNAIKHAGASRVTIEIAVEGDACLARVGDDGRGGAIVAVGGGLAGVRDRVAALGGRLELHSPKTGGTVLEVCLPSSAVAVDGAVARYSAIPVEVLG